MQLLVLRDTLREINFLSFMNRKNNFQIGLQDSLRTFIMYLSQDFGKFCQDHFPEQ